MNRRAFITKSAIGSSLLAAGAFPFCSFAGTAQKLTILHTADVHGRLHSFAEDAAMHAGLGGVELRAAIIKNIREHEANMLLLDAGDMMQSDTRNNGHEIQAMNAMGYDAATLGDHDFDCGIEQLATRLAHTTFPIVIANCDFAHTPLESKTQPYTIVKRGALKIGIFGIGIDFDGLVHNDVCGNTKCLEPLPVAQYTAHKLKRQEQCDMVICLSHLGYRYDNSNKVSDVVLAKESEHIDLILGGHTHTFLEAPVSVNNRKGEEVLINHIGWGGTKVGQLNYVTDSKKKSKLLNAQSVIVGKQTRGE